MISIAALLILTLGIIAAVFWIVPPAEGLGDLVRIIYVHVPTAWLAVIAFIVSAAYAASYLRRGEMSSDDRSARAVWIGFISVMISTITGMIFSKLTWGAYWNWDPRQTTIFVLILIYGAYLTLRTAVVDPRTRAKVSAIYSLLSVLTVPFLVFILPRMYFSLHPSPLINSSGSIDMDRTMLIVLIAAIVDATLIFIWLMRRR